MSSPVTIDIKAVDDVDVYEYLYLIDEFFPGHVTVESIELKREANINLTILRSIASGGNPELVTAKIEAIWRTMVPQENVADLMKTEGGI